MIMGEINPGIVLLVNLFAVLVYLKHEYIAWSLCDQVRHESNYSHLGYPFLIKLLPLSFNLIGSITHHAVYSNSLFM